MKNSKIFYIPVCLLLNACALNPEQVEHPYRLSEIQAQIQPAVWRLEGRLAIVKNNEAFSLSVNWHHASAVDEIELSGPLSQGLMAIKATPNGVEVDNGESRQQYPADIDGVMAQELGVAAPVSALKFWVLGVNEPQLPFTMMDAGFLQADWAVKYAELQFVRDLWLPKRLILQKADTRLKLVIDRWSIE